MERFKGIDELRRLRGSLQKEDKDKGVIKACGGSACRASGSQKVVQAIIEEVDREGLNVEVKITGCRGLCSKSPNIKVEPHGIFYTKVKPDNVPGLIGYTFLANIPFRPLLYRDDIMSEPVVRIEDIPLYRKQLRLVLRHNGLIGPRSITDYIKAGGYLSIEKALFSMTPHDIIGEIKDSGLRGRGGAGFLTGIKWEVVRRARNKIKIVVANGDEGDPGAFMDRAIMEGNPHSLIEGMLICAYAVGARYGFAYVRHEYPLAVENFNIAAEQARNIGLLGDNILGTDFSFDISIMEGAGAFVCGEETALLASIEGRRGSPTQRPPFPAERGAWSYPTCINNIETLVNVPYIIEHESANFVKFGTERSRGTKVFALAGKVKNSCLVEVPMGITLREIVYDIGGGIIGGKKFKAIQIGGPSGGCLPEDMLDTSIDFDTLVKAGAMMGSGGMVVLDEDDCMVDIAKYFLSFCRLEACGKCPSCRIGTYQMLQILDKITKGEGVPEDIGRLQYIGNMVKKGSLCGLGKTASNPVLSTIKYFREEYEEHINNKFCRAKACKGLGLYKIDNEECLLCGACKQVCAYNAVVELKDSFYIDQDYCTKCKACYEACPFDTVKIEGCYPHV